MKAQLRFFLLLTLVLITALGASLPSWGQCVPVRDPRAGNRPTFRPLKQFRCIPNGAPDSTTFTLTFTGPVSNFMVDWGDGTGPQLVAGPATSVSRRFGRGLFRYRVWFSGCTTDTVRGDFINDRNTTVPGIGFITPPAGFANKRCVPEALTIVNQSPGMNGFTEFVINWGDLSLDTIDYSSFGQSISHTYQPATTGCNIRITVTYQNLCGATPGGLSPSAIYGEYYFLDRDTAVVAPASILLCEPADVQFTDQSILNCLDSNDREVRWLALTGFNNPLPFPGNNVWRPRTGATRTLNIPRAALLPVPADSTYTLRFAIRNQCGPDSATATIRIVAPRRPVFAVLNDNPCPGQPMNFSNSTPNPSGAQTYRWEWGDGSSEVNNGTNVSHTYNLGGTYWVRLYSIINGYGGQVCQQVDSIQVRVQRTVTPIVNVAPRQTCGDTLTVRVANRSRNMTTVVWGGWSLGSGVTAGSGFIPTIPGSNPAVAEVISTNAADSSARVRYKLYGRYTVRLTASSTGCPSLSDADTVFIYPRPTLRFRLSDRRFCVGQALQVRDSSRVIPTANRGLPTGWNHLQWRLSMGDGTVYQSPANITNNFDSPGASGRATFHTYAAPGTYWVRLSVRTPFGCEVIDSQQVVVQPSVVPSFAFSQDVCDPTQVTIRNQSDRDTARYEFSFSRGPVLYTRIVRPVRDTFSVTLPYVGPGDTTYYTVVLRAVTGVPGDTCSVTTAPRIIKVRPAPVALFSVSQADGCTPLAGVQFFNNSYNLPSTGGFTVQWAFGNGNTFTGENPPLQTYLNPGSSLRRDTARLTLISPQGCRFTAFRPIITYPAPNAAIVAPDTVCAGASVTFSATGNGLATYLWRFTDLDGTTSTSPLPSKTLPNFGTAPVSYTVQLDVQTAAGCSASVSRQITAAPRPVAGFSATPEEVCGLGTVPVAFNAQPGSTNARYYFYTYGDGNSRADSLLPTATHTYPANLGVNPITYTASLVVRSALGCPSLPFSRTITVRPAVRAIFSADTDRVCAPGTVNFANIGFRNGVDYTWFVRTVGGTGLGASFTPNLANGSFRYTFGNPGNQPVLRYVVTLVAGTAGSFAACADTTADTITVYGVPTAAFTLVSQTPASGCSPLQVLARPDTTVAGSTYTWNFGDGTAPVSAASPQAQTHLYTNTTNTERGYSLTLTTTTPFGCQAQVTTEVRVKPVPRAAFTLSDSIGCAPLRVLATNGSSAAADNFVWLVNGQPVNFDRNPDAFSFASTSATDTTRYVLRLVARGIGNACVDTSAPRLVRVLPKPTLVLTPDPVAGCSPLALTLATTGSAGLSRVIYQRRLAGTLAWTTLDTTDGAPTQTILFNNGGADQVYQLRALVQGSSGCADSALVSVTVSPAIQAQMEVLPGTVGCSPFTATLRNRTTSAAANSFVWRINGQQVSASPTEFAYTFENLSPERDTVFVVELVAASQSSGCPSVVQRRIRVKPRPTVDFDMALTPPSACSPVEVRYTYVGNRGASRYTWLFGTSDTLRTTADTAIVRNFSNLGLVPAVRPVRLTASNAFGCAASVQKDLTINPLVRAAFRQTAATGCAPLTVTFTSESSVGADVLEWIVDGVSRGNAQTFTYTFVNTGLAPVSYRVQLAVRNSLAGLCADTADTTITVSPTPRLTGLDVTPVAGCSPLRTSLAATGTGIGTYTWDFTDGTRFDTGAAAVQHTFVNLATAANRVYNPRVIATNAFGCTDSLSRAVTVRPGSSAIIRVADTAGCAPLRAQFIGSASVNANVYTWDFGDGGAPSTAANPVKVFANDDDTVRQYTVRLVAQRAGGFCPDTAYRTITVYPLPRVAMAPADTMGCQPLAVRYRATTTGTDSIRWEFTSLAGTATVRNRAVVDTIYQNLDPANATVQVQLLGYNRFGCQAGQNQLTTVGPLVEAQFSQSADSGCTPLRVRFTGASTPGVLGQWLVNGTPVGNAASGLTYTFINPGQQDTTYRVQLVVFNPQMPTCTDTATATVTVFARPDAGTLFASPTQGCSPLLVELNGNATGATTYNWDMGDGTRFDTASQTISYTFVNNLSATNRTFTVRQIALTANGCADTTTTRILVRPLVRAGFTASDTAGCAPLAVQFNAATSFNANTFSWDFGDSLGTATGRTPFYRFENHTDTVRSYTVTLVADRAGVGCPSVAQRVITVYPVPRAAFTPTDTAGCQPLAVRLQSLAQGADSLAWTIASGSDLATYPGRPAVDTSIANPTAQLLTLTTRLEAYNRFGCTNAATGRLRVAPFTQAGIDLAQDSACTPFRLVAGSLASAGAQVQWFINGTPQAVTGSVLRATLFNFSDRDSTVELMLVATNRLAPGCADTVRRRVVVLARPNAGTLFASPDAGCSPLLVELNGNATGATTYNWDMGDGTSFDTTSQTVSHTFQNLGSVLTRTFAVRLVATNDFGCADTARRLVSVRPNVTAGIVAPVRQGCSPLGVQLSSASSVNANLYTWTFGDGSSGSNAAEPFHVFTNETDTVVRFTVRLVADKAGIGCPDEDTVTITVFPRPAVAFTPPDTMGCQPFALRFASATRRADSLRWTFERDTLRSVFVNRNTLDTTLANPSAEVQEHRVTLWAANRLGCADSVQRRVRVQPLVRAGLLASADSGCTPLAVTFTSQVAEGNRVQWFIDGQLVSQNPTALAYTFVHNGLADTSFTVMQVAASRFGAQCTDTVRKTIRVFGKPRAGVLFASPASGCSPLLVELNGAAEGATRYSWNLDDGTRFDTAVQTISHIYTNPLASQDQRFRPELVAINRFGCTDTARTDITVKPGVAAGFTPSDTAGCAPLGVLFTNGSRNANLYQWDFGDGSGTSFATNPFRVFENRTDTVVRYTVRLVADQNGVGCPATAERIITVYPRPVAAFVPGDTAGCQPFAISLQNQSRGAQTWRWTLASPGTTVVRDTASRIDTVLANPTASILETTVSLQVTSAFGCVAERTQTIRTLPLVAAGFAQSADSGCSPLRVRFENRSAAGNQTSWTIGGQYVGASTGSFDYTFINNTGRDSVVTIELAVQHPNAPGCADTLRRQIRVFAKPVAGLLSPQPEAGCSPLETQIVGSATGAVRYRFSFGDGAGADTTVQTLPHLYTNSTSVLATYTAQLIAISEHGCADTTTAPVRVRPMVTARISLIDSAGCTPLLARFSGATSLNANRYTWDMGDGAAPRTGADVAYTYRNPSDTVRRYTIRLVADLAGNNCPDTAFAQIRVYPQPVAAIAASATEGCSPFAVRLTDQSTTQGRQTRLVFTDGTDIDTVLLRGTTLDTVLVNNTSQRKTVWVEAITETPQGCTDRRRLPLYVNPALTASFVRPNAGCAPLTVAFRNTSRNADDLYEWDFGDGSAPSADKNPVHVFRYNGPRDTLFVVTLRARSNAFFQPVCEAIYRDTVRVSGQPRGAFAFVPDGVVRLPINRITLRNQTLYRPSWRYQWSFGDGSTDTTSAELFTHTLTGLQDSLATLSLTVRLVVTSPAGCTDTVRLPLQVLPIAPVAAFEGPAAGCAPLDVVFKNASRFANRFEWNFGDGTTSEERNPSKRFTRPGTYTIRLIAYGPGGSDTATRTDIINVYEVPSAAFTTFPRAPRKLRIPDDELIGILREPRPGETYLWEFGDGATSADAEPRHKYTAVGNYTIILTVTSAEGCIARDTARTPVEVENGGFWLVPNAFTPNKSGPTGGFVDPESRDVTNDVFYPFTQGVVEIDLQIFNRWGEAIFRSQRVGYGWDGYFKGAPCPTDTYVYKLRARFIDGTVKESVGDLTLLRE